AVRNRACAGARKPFVRATQGTAMAQHHARLLVGGSAAGFARRHTETEWPHPRAHRRGHPGAGTRGARRRYPLAREDARGGRATVGRLPGTRLSQNLARHPCRARHDALWLPDAGRNDPDRLVRAPGRTRGSHGGEYRHAVDRHGPNPHLDFAANRPDWLVDPEHWQGVTRAVEDKLSDALHDRLTERFVDRRTSVLMRRLRENAVLET